MSGSIDDLVSTQKGGVTNLSQIAQTLPFMSSFLNGNTLAVNIISTTSTQVLAPATGRISIVFHNPSDSVALMLCPAFDATGTTLLASFTTRGGGYLLLPQDYLALSGNCQSAWNAVAASGSGNPLTISTK